MVGRLRVFGFVVLLIAGTTTSPANAQSAPEAVVRAHIEAHNAHDIEALLKTLAEVVDMRILVPDGTPETKNLLDRAQQRQRFLTAFRFNPNARSRVLSVVTSGSTVVVRDEGTGLVGGTRQAGLALYRVDRGRISAIWILNTEAVHRE
jgi:hypothetical protein